MTTPNPQLPTHNSQLRAPNSTGGYVALLTVIIMGAITTLIAASLLTLSVVYNKNAITRTKSQSARFNADSCAEEALRIIKTNVYTGTASFDVDGDAVNDCSYAISGTQPNLSINAQNIPNPADGPMIKILVTINAVNPKVIVTSWVVVP